MPGRWWLVFGCPLGGQFAAWIKNIRDATGTDFQLESSRFQYSSSRMNTRNGPNGQQHQHQQPWETATFALSYRRHGPQQQQQQNQQHDSVIPGIPGHDNINDNGNNRNSDNSNNSSNNTSSTRHQKPRPIPSAETMKERWLHRNKILDEKKSHLLVHPHNGMADTGRNIAFVLHDRERRGPQALTKQCHWKTPLPNERHDDCQTLETNAVYSGDDEKIGYQSPSTVVETNLRSALAATNSTINAARNSSAGMEPINTHMDAVVYSKPANPLLHDSVHGSGLSSNSSSSASNITNGEPFAHESIASREEGNRFSLRRVTYPLRISREIRTFGEYCAATKYHSAFLEHLGGDDALDPEGNRPPSSRAVSTISVAFSPDGQTMASTHGDHTVKISCCTTGRLLQSLDGHPRTPWTVKYHPMDARILASGCLGHQVRVWNWERKLCLQMVRLEFAIISLSFHPTGTVLAIANGTRLHFWGIDDYEDAPAVSAGARQLRNVVTSIQPYEQPHRTVVGAEQQQTALSASVSNKRSTHLTEWDQRHMLRCVHFPPNGNTLIIGGVNPMQEDSRRWQQNGGGNGGMSFYLRLWDFDMTKALDSDNDTAAAVSPIGISMVRRAISNVRYRFPLLCFREYFMS